MKILVDLRTGEPVIDFEGNLCKITTTRSFNQYLDVLFRTPVLSEPFMLHWGLPINEIIQASASPNWEATIKYLVVDALSKQKEPLVDSIDSVELKRNATELAISVSVKSKYGTTSRNLVSLNE